MARLRCLVLFASVVLVLACGGTDPFGFRSEEVSVAVGDFDLRGTIVSPLQAGDETGTGSAIGVLVLPAAGPTDRNGRSRHDPHRPPLYRSWAEMLAREGVTVLRYDKRFLTHRVLEAASWDQEAQIEEAAAAYRFLRAHPSLRGGPVHLIGHGEGGNVAIALATRMGADESPASVIVVNGWALPIEEVVVARLQASGTPAPELRAAEAVFERIGAGTFPSGRLHLGAGPGYWSQWSTMSARAAADVAALEMPVLIVQCLADARVPKALLDLNLDRWRSSSQSPGVTLRVHAALDHLTREAGSRAPSPAVAAEVVEWLRGPS